MRNFTRPSPKITTGELVTDCIVATKALVEGLKKGGCPEAYIEKWLSEIARKALEKAA